jgi:biotin carboxylase
LVPSFTYRAPDFVAAAQRLDVEVVVGSDRRQALAEAMGDRAVVVDMADGGRGAAALIALHERTPLDAIVAVDDAGVVVAAEASAAIGLPHNPVDAVRATRDKGAMRRALAEAGVRQPDFFVVDDGDGPTAPAFPCVVKPVGLSASRGVIRADDQDALEAAAARARRIAGDDRARLVVERFIPGAEVAVEGVLVGGALRVLAIFDKPDPLDGPYFEETIYVTPSRLPAATQDDVAALVAHACKALGLVEGPIHAEARVDDHGVPWLLEVAARSIGGLCARTLRFGAGVQLEELILRHAIGRSIDGLARERAAAGVMMLPVPRAGVLRAVDGQDAARAVPGVVELDITVVAGRSVEPLPEGDRYLGFVFARGDGPAAVERSLRDAHSQLSVVIDDPS